MEKIPEKHSLDSMEGIPLIKDKNVYEVLFNKLKEGYGFAIKIEEVVKEELGKFDFFEDGFFESVYAVEDRFLGGCEDNNPTWIPHYVSLDIFNRLLEQGLLNEEDKETFCFAFISKHTFQKEVERYLIAKRDSKSMEKLNLDLLKVLVDNYLPNIELFVERNDIQVIDEAIRNRAFKICLANRFRRWTSFNVSVEDWQKNKDTLWQSFINSNKDPLERDFPKELLDGFLGVQNYAYRLDVTELNENIRRPFSASWPHDIGHSFRTLSTGNGYLDFYRFGKLKEILVAIKAEFGL